MTRLIEADALKSALAHAAKDYCNRNGPMRTIDFESLIEKAPTIDAIPVEWLDDRANDITRAPLYRRYAQMLMDEWQKEQEAQDE
jgi:hypothetical protein